MEPALPTAVETSHESAESAANILTALSPSELKPSPTQAADHNKNAPGLFKLPAEVRNRIYRYALHREDTVSVQASLRHRLPALVRASKQLRAEARQIFCEENTFLVRVKPARLPSREHWIWHLGGGRQAEFFNIGMPLNDAFMDWVRRYWDRCPIPAYSRVARDREMEYDDQAMYELHFAVMDDLRGTNATFQVVERLYASLDACVAYLKAEDHWILPEINEYSMERMIQRQFDQRDWDNWPETAAEGTREAWLWDC